jgi:hypothetical protein
MPGGVAAGATGDHAGRHLVPRLQRPKLAAVLVQEPQAIDRSASGTPGGMDVRETSDDSQNSASAGRQVDPQLRPQPVGEQPADVVHVASG